MMIMYDKINVAAHLAFGLVEEAVINKEQKLQLKQINFLIEALRKDISILYKKLNVFSTAEAIKKAEENQDIDDEIRDWMTNIFVKQTNFIAKKVDEFNRQYAKNYNKLIPKKE